MQKVRPGEDPEDDTRLVEGPRSLCQRGWQYTASSACVLCPAGESIHHVPAGAILNSHLYKTGSMTPYGRKFVLAAPRRSGRGYCQLARILLCRSDEVRRRRRRVWSGRPDHRGRTRRRARREARVRVLVRPLCRRDAIRRVIARDKLFQRRGTLKSLPWGGRARHRVWARRGLRVGLLRRSAGVNDGWRSGAR